MKFLLFIIAITATSTLTVLYLPINIIYYIFTFKWKTGSYKIGQYFYQMALSIDQFANVSLQTPLNFLMIKKNHLRHEQIHFKFGDEDDTVSYGIAMNQKLDSLTKFGKFWGWFLNKVDKDHLKKALINKRKKDLEALKRVSKINLN